MKAAVLSQNGKSFYDDPTNRASYFEPKSSPKIWRNIEFRSSYTKKHNITRHFDQKQLATSINFFIFF